MALVSPRLLDVSVCTIQHNDSHSEHNKIIIIIMYRLYSATLLRDPAALYSKSDINIKSIE